MPEMYKQTSDSGGGATPMPACYGGSSVGLPAIGSVGACCKQQSINPAALLVFCCWPADVAYCITVSSSPPQAPPVPSAEADNETDSTLNVLTAAANRSDLTTRECTLDDSGHALQA